jgi:hypothetical protein
MYPQSDAQQILAASASNGGRAWINHATNPASGVMRDLL